VAQANIQWRLCLSSFVRMLFSRLDGIPEPPEGYVPPLGSSRNTWANIYKNKGRIDYCVQQFGVSFCSSLVLSLLLHTAREEPGALEWLLSRRRDSRCLQYSWAQMSRQSI